MGLEWIWGIEKSKRVPKVTFFLPCYVFIILFFTSIINDERIWTLNIWLEALEVLTSWFVKLLIYYVGVWTLNIALCHVREVIASRSLDIIDFSPMHMVFWWLCFFIFFINPSFTLERERERGSLVNAFPFLV